MNELQWRGIRGVGSGTSRLEVEAAWVGGSCPGRRSLCRGDVLYTTERQIASSLTRKPLARSSLPSSFLSLFSLLSYSFSFSFSFYLSTCFSLTFLSLLLSHSFSLFLSFPPSFPPFLFLCLFLVLSSSLFTRLVAIPSLARLGPSRSSRCSLSVRCSFFLGPFILLGPPFRLSPFDRFFGASERARSSRRESLCPRRAAYSYLAVLRGSGYARRLRQRWSCGTFYQEFQCHVLSSSGWSVWVGRLDERLVWLVDRCSVSCWIISRQ